MASYPSFEPGSIRDESTWRRMSEQAEDYTTQPVESVGQSSAGHHGNRRCGVLLSARLDLQNFVAGAAIDLGIINEQFTCRGEGFTPEGSGRAINDFDGEVHGSPGFQDAFRHVV